MTDDPTRKRGLRWLALGAALLLLVLSGVWWNARRASAVQPRAELVEASHEANEALAFERGAAESAREVELALAAPTEQATEPHAPSAAHELALRLIDRSNEQPLAEAAVRLVEFARPEPFLAAASACTDEHGSARFAGVAPGHVRAYALGILVRTLEFDPSESELELVPIAVRSVDCLVRDAHATPVPSAQLWLAYDGLPHELLGAVDADGRCAIARVALRARIYATAAGHASSTALEVTDASSELHFTLGGAHGAARGLVQDLQGAALEGVRVELRPLPVQASLPARWTSTDVGGRFELEGLPPGNVRVVAGRREHAPHASVASIAAGETAELVLVLARGATVRGRISNARGEPAASVSVNVGRFGDWWTASTSSDASGEYELAHLAPGAVKVVADSERFERAEAELELLEGETRTWSPRLDNGRTLRGTLLDPERAPLADWTIARVDAANPTSWHWKSASAADGGFELGRCPPGRFRVAFSAPQSPTEPFVADFDPGEEPVVVIVPWEWMPASQLLFDLRTPGGDRAAGAECTATYADRPGRGVRCHIETLEDGLRVGGLRAGEFDLRFEYKDCGPIVLRDLALAPRESRQLGLLQFEAGAWLRVEHVDEHGVPVHRASVLTSTDLPQAPLGQLPRLGTRQVAQGSEFEFGPLTPGAYCLVTRLGSTGDSETNVSLGAGQRELVRVGPLPLPPAAPK